MAKIGLFTKGLVILGGAVLALGQTGGSRILIRNQAPMDHALDIPLAVLQAEFADMKGQKRLTTRMIEGGTYSLNARYLAGSEAPQVHKSITEFYFIREGTATLVTGGSIVNKTISGGVERSVKPGDVVFIPPGVPHAIRDTTGISYLNVHFGGTD